jgi:uncharacterized protein (TIGR00251 family)
MLEKILVKVKASSHFSKVIENEDCWQVWLKSPAKQGKANQELIELLADYCQVPKNQIEIQSGFSSPIKIIKVSRF